MFPSPEFFPYFGRPRNGNAKKPGSLAQVPYVKCSNTIRQPIGIVRSSSLPLRR